MTFSSYQRHAIVTIPDSSATVDVVIQSYDLIEPLTAPYVYAIGLTQERFPKMNTSFA